VAVGPTTDTDTDTDTKENDVKRTPLKPSTGSSAENDPFDAEEQRRLEKLKREFIEKNGALIEEWRREAAEKAKSSA
jgi:hypothetical protein